MKNKWWIGPAIGTILLLVFLLLPPIEPLTPLGMKTIGIFLFTAVWWATVGIGYPSVLCIALIALTGVMTPVEVFAVSYGWWITLFFLGSCGLTMGLRTTGFSRRFALWFISRPFVAGHPWRLVGMFLLSCTIFGSIMTAAATAIISMAIAEPMLQALGYKRGDKFAATFMMGVAWAATAALLMTPFGHSGNILIIDWIKRDFGYEISFLHFLAFGIPVGLMVLGMLLLIYRFIVNPDVSRVKELSAGYVAQEVRNLGSMKTGEKIAVGTFLVVIIWWLLPSFISSATEVGAYLNKVGIAIPALAGAVLLCVIRVEGKPVLTFREWMIEGVEWDTLTLIAAIGAVTVVIENPNTGIIQFMDGFFRPFAQAVPFTIFLMLTVFMVTLLTNAMSNLVSQTLTYTIMMPIALAVGKGNPALAVVISAASNIAFSLPSATTSTALVTGSGWVPVPFMLKYGLLVFIPVVLLFSFVVYPFALLIFR
jgi:sodium-dependent dicarboxylate transporter 2/3/5